LVRLFFGFRQLHSSLGEQDNVLHRQCVRSCHLGSFLAVWIRFCRQQQLAMLP